MVTETHDLETGACDVIGLEHGTCGAWWGNDKNAGYSGGSGVEGVFRQSSDVSPTKVAGGNGGTEQW